MTDEQDGTPYRGRVIKVIDHGRTRILGIFRKNADGGGRLIQVDKKQEAASSTSPRPTAATPKDGDLISVDLIRTRGYGLASARVKERLGSIASEKAISLIAINTHDIPQVFSAAAVRESEEAKPATLQGREDWRRRAARHHRSASRQGP